MSIIALIGTNTQTLRNVETQIGVASQNIGNAQNQNYVRRDTSTAEVAGGGAVVDVTRATDTALSADVLTQSANATGADLTNSVYQQLEQLTGSANGSPTLVTATQSLQTALQALAATPESSTTKQNALSAAQGLVSTVQTLANGIETIAGQVLSGAQSDVATLNSDLSTIASLNGQIRAATAAGTPTADLEDQRDAAVSAVGALVPLSAKPAADGTLSLSTPSGITLVSGSTASQFNLSAPVPGSGGVEGTNASLTLQGDASGASLNAGITGGKIGAELSILRVDDAGAASSSAGVAPLEKARRQLDAFVDQFYAAPPATPTAFQQAYNSATAASGELGSNLFVVTAQTGSGTPQPAGSDRFNFQLNDQIRAGTATIKAGAANALAQAMGSSSAASVTAGDVTGFTGSLTSLAQTIATSQTNRADTAQSASTQADATLSAVSTAYSNQTGVSVDNELSRLVVLQNSYNATAKVISVVSTLFQTLTSDLT